MLKNIQFVFFLLGQAPLPENRCFNESLKWFKFAPTTLFLFITFFAIREFFKHNDLYTISEAIVGSIVLFFSNLIVLLAIVQPYFYRHNFLKINKIMKEIEIEFKNSVSRSLELPYAIKSYYVQVIYVVGLTVALLFSKVLLPRLLVFIQQLNWPTPSISNL